MIMMLAPTFGRLLVDPGVGVDASDMKGGPGLTVSRFQYASTVSPGKAVGSVPFVSEAMLAGDRADAYTAISSIKAWA